MTSHDWPAVVEIYRQGIESGDATFETEAPDWEVWDAARSPECRIVAEVGGEVVGYAGLSQVSERPVYAGVREVMIYVAESARGKGVGGKLLGRIVEETEKEGMWTLQAGIFPENAASIRIFEKCGFRVLGTHERLGRFHDGRWARRGADGEAERGGGDRLRTRDVAARPSPYATSIDSSRNTSWIRFQQLDPLCHRTLERLAPRNQPHSPGPLVDDRRARRLREVVVAAGSLPS